VDIRDLDDLLKANEAFSALPAGELATLARRFTPLVFRMGDVVLDPAKPDGALFAVYAGRARLIEEKPGAEPVTLAVLLKGDTFGEHTLLGAKEAYTVRAASDLVVLRLDAQSVTELADSSPAFRAALARRVEHGVELAFLSRLSLFSKLKLPQLTRLMAMLTRVELKANQELFAQGEPGDTAYIVRDGRLRLSRSVNGRPRQVGVARPGELVGEMGLLLELPHVVTATAATPAVVLALSREAFDGIVAEEDKHTALLEVNNRLLQLGSFTMDPEADAPPARASLRVEWVKAERGWLARSYPLVRVETPLLSGLACLAMAEAAHGKSGVSPAVVDRRLAEARPDTMDSLTRSGEDLGYVTRLVHLAPPQLLDLTLPVVIEPAAGEFALLVAANRARVLLAHPLHGFQSVPRTNFDQSWDGRALCLTRLPVADFSSGSTTAIYRQFLPFAKPHLIALIAVGVLSLLAQFLGLAAPLFSQVIIDRVFVTFDFGLLNLLLFGMLTVTAFQLMAGGLREIVMAHVMRRISSDLQLRFFDHILALPIGTLISWRVGDFIVRLREHENLLRLVSNSGFQAMLSSFAIAVNIVLLFSMSARMAPVALIFVAAYAALMVFSSPHLRAASSALFDARAESESHFIESITGIQTIKSLALEPHTYRAGYGLVDRLKRREFHMANLSFHVGQIGSVLSQLATVIVLGWGASLALNGEITTGQLVAFNALLGATLAPLTALVGVWDELKELRISFERTAEVLRLPREQSPPNAAAFAIRGDISLEQVTFRYSPAGDAALRDVTLTVRAGQKVALVGRSGSGKTTLASLLLSLYAPTEGRILVDQVDMTAIHKPTLRRQIGYVEQQPQLFSGTIRDNIAKSDPTAGLETIVAAATTAGAHAFIQDLPLAYDTEIGERGMTLSGGQQQRLVIARALLTNPRMIVLDEATSALDTESEQVIQRNLDAIMAGKTSVVIAHRLSTVRNADKIVVLDDGRIVEEGTHAQLMAQQGLYYYLATNAS
jgi:HlyB family type I secretion system ABC transporter